MANLSTMASDIHALVPGTKVCGPALTVVTRAGDFLPILVALHGAGPGDVLVIDNQGQPDTALWGEITTTEARRKGLAGLVADGFVRDIDGIREAGYPVFARGTSPKVAGRSSLGAVNVPVQCGGVVVNPGDIIVGDSDGVVVVPCRQAAAIVDLAERIGRYEADLLQKVASGLSQQQIFEPADQWQALRRKHLHG
jgi:regulator of RNase E activity RraA